MHNGTVKGSSIMQIVLYERTSQLLSVLEVRYSAHYERLTEHGCRLTVVRDGKP